MRHQPLFTGGQITTIAVAVAATIILAPVGVMAATGSPVTIADPSHPSRKAEVTSAGALRVAPQGTQTVRGTVKVNNLPTTQKVSGTVTAQPGLPGTPFARRGDYSASTPLTVPAGKHLVIQTLSIFAALASPSKVLAEVDYTSGGSPGSLYVPLTKAFSYTITGDDYWNAVVNVNIYADPGSKVVLSLLAPNGGISDRSLAISGYLV